MATRGPRRNVFRMAPAILAVLSWETALAQPCNPAIDGTYCATQTYRAQHGSKAASPPTRFDGLGSSLSPPPDLNEPGMLGAITFSTDGRRCLGGLLRGVHCN
jgi:hypothetical protein